MDMRYHPTTIEAIEFYRRRSAKCEHRIKLYEPVLRPDDWRMKLLCRTKFHSDCLIQELIEEVRP